METKWNSFCHSGNILKQPTKFGLSTGKKSREGRGDHLQQINGPQRNPRGGRARQNRRGDIAGTSVSERAHVEKPLVIDVPIEVSDDAFSSHREGIQAGYSMGRGTASGKR
eukprot:9153168-Pyramimonas_sp.AAC.1